MLTNTPLTTDGKKPITRLVRPGHELVEFDWNENTGEGHFTYEVEGTAYHEGHTVKCVATSSVVREQPAGRRHVGWRWHNGRYT